MFVKLWVGLSKSLGVQEKATQLLFREPPSGPLKRSATLEEKAIVVEDLTN